MTRQSIPKTSTQLQEEIAGYQRRIAELEASHQELRDQVERLQESEEKLRILLDDSSDPIFTFFRDGTYRYVNEAFARGVNRPVNEIIGRKIWDVFPKEEADKRYNVLNWVFENAQTRVFEVRVPREDEDLYFITTVKPVFDENRKVKSVVCISKEITDRKLIERELLHLSTHDTLTGMFNRNFFEVELARLQHGAHFPVSIIVLDLDNLKSVNDAWGHAIGDEIIQQAAGIIRDAIRQGDIAARIGGDEFVILLPSTGVPGVTAVVERLKHLLKNHPDHRVHFSAGMATGLPGDDLNEILRLADDQMYREKHDHKLTHPRFD